MSVLTPPLGHRGRLRRVWGLHVSLGHGGGGVWSPLKRFRDPPAKHRNFCKNRTFRESV